MDLIILPVIVSHYDVFSFHANCLKSFEGEVVTGKRWSRDDWKDREDGTIKKYLGLKKRWEDTGLLLTDS